MRALPLLGHPLLTCSAIRSLEARGLAATPEGTLMARAADAVADACASLLRTLPARTPVLALAGPGNNGGDALLAALRLAERGWSVHAIARGEYSDGVTPRGKPGPAAKHGARQGINDYTAWFAGDHDMRGDYFGYDGPCPPWNDELRHRYIFTVFALDIEQLPVEGKFGGQQVRDAMQGHILEEARLTGVYSLNPSVKTQ